MAIRFDPEWKGLGIVDEIRTTLRVLFKGIRDPIEPSERNKEFQAYVHKFRGEVDGKISRLADLGLNPRVIDGQGLIDILYPVLNRRSTKGWKISSRSRQCCSGSCI